MKAIMFFSFFVSFLSCKAQVLPLNTATSNIPQNATVKDLNNELNSFVGIYKANFQGNEITLYITKQEQKPEKTGQKNYYMDVLIIKYIVKSSTGSILQDTQNNVYDIELYSISTTPAQNKVNFFYSATNCSVGWVRIILKKVNANQISWDYYPDDITTTADKCPPTLDTTIYLPETKDLIFIKQ